MTHDEAYQARVDRDARNYPSKDELLAKIDEDIKFVNETFYKPNTGMLEIRDRIVSRLYSLRAVVEYHQPYESKNYGLLCRGCDEDPNYPCGTIQAIEKKLACDCCNSNGKCKECGDAQKEEL